jgi:hypothetical protein
VFDRRFGYRRVGVYSLDLSDHAIIAAPPTSPVAFCRV